MFLRLSVAHPFSGNRKRLTLYEAFGTANVEIRINLIKSTVTADTLKRRCPYTDSHPRWIQQRLRSRCCNAEAPRVHKRLMTLDRSALLRPKFRTAFEAGAAISQTELEDAHGLL